MKAAALLVAGLMAAAAFPAAPAPAGERPYTVEARDTVYTISEAIAPPSVDVRRLTWEICRKNGIKSGVIHPGDVLTVPTFEK